MRAVVILLVVVVAIWVLYVQAIVSAARRPAHAYRAVSRTRSGTVVMLVLTGFIGGIYYLLRIRPEVMAAERTVPAPPAPPKDTGDFKEWLRTRDPWS